MDKFIKAEFGFAEIGKWFSDLYEKATTADVVKGIWEMVEKVFTDFALIASIALIVLSLVQVFFGKKLLGLQKFLAFLAVGFACGVVLVAPLLPAVPGWIIGAVVGVVAALLCKFLYVIAYIVGVGYSVYLLAYPLVLNFVGAEMQMIVAAAAAAVAIVLALLLRKWLEMLGTAALGGYCLALSIDSLLVQLVGGGFDRIKLTHEYADIIVLAITGVAALIGFIVQVKTRRRY